MKQYQEGSTQLRFTRSLSSDEKVPVIRETPQNSECVHVFDGKLFKIPIKSRTSDEKRALFSVFRNKISTLPIPNPSIIRNMEVIMDEMSMPQNYLATDGLFADDVLAEIIDIIIHKDTDVIPIFLEMLLDMNSGLCCSGRVVRLHQILMALKD